MRILYIYRHPDMGYSIGKMFRPIEEEMRIYAEVDSIYLPVPNYRLKGLWNNIHAAFEAYAMLDPIRTSVNAINRIWRFNIFPDSFYVLVLPIAYVVSTTIHSADWMMVSVITPELLAILLRVWYATKVGSINVGETVMRIIRPCALVAVMSSVVCCGLNCIISEGIIGL